MRFLVNAPSCPGGLGLYAEFPAAAVVRCAINWRQQAAEAPLEPLTMLRNLFISERMCRCLLAPKRRAACALSSELAHKVAAAYSHRQSAPLALDTQTRRLLVDV
jgi:hypothetical protein